MEEEGGRPKQGLVIVFSFLREKEGDGREREGDERVRLLGMMGVGWWEEEKPVGFSPYCHPLHRSSASANRFLSNFDTLFVLFSGFDRKGFEMLRKEIRKKKKEEEREEINDSEQTDWRTQLMISDEDLCVNP
uniref:Uncharacterized protein n=1 Tax=Pristionchus pacificus TaxID=54126 RepID=A0A2A6D0B5_PRIPA|eukprot:PDM83757.1 hypothetical protein PRIPAC_30244 [Pristionchus pacificus]